MNPINPFDLEIIAKAKAALEADSMALRLNNYVGKKLDGAVKKLPDAWQSKLSKGINYSLSKATEWAFATTGSRECPVLREDWMHMAGVLGSGFLGGAGGFSTVVWELPASTMIMMRSIGCIAEKEGLNMSDPKTRLGCVSVLAMGADPKRVQSDELGYWVTRKAMAGLVTKVLEWNGRGTVPPLVQFITKTSARFGVVISEKIAAQVAPGVGALAGAGINGIYLNHYQNVAHAHFSIERLCMTYGETSVKEAYARI